MMMRQSIILWTTATAYYWTATATTTTSPPPLGTQLYPTVVLNVSEANQTDTKCVTLNGLDLCTTIDYCPHDAYNCEVFETPPGIIGRACSILPNVSCGCTATYGNATCDCSVNPHRIDFVSTQVSCYQALFGENLAVDLSNPHCTDPFGFYYLHQNESVCYDGSIRFTVTRPFEVDWECSRENILEDDETAVVGGVAKSSWSSSLKPERDCTCQAYYNYQNCTECQFCPHDTPGEVRAVCPGFFMDCYQVYSTWLTDNNENDSPSSDGVVLRASCWVWAILFTICSVVLHNVFSC